MGTPDPIAVRPAHAGWTHLAWKVLLSLTLILLLFSGIPISPDFFGAFFQSVLLLWGALVVAVAVSNLTGGSALDRSLMSLLAVGAYAALAVPAVLREPQRLVEALGPAAALTLVAQLPRRDLPRALRDWGVLMGLVLYVAFGIVSLWRVVDATGTLVLVAVLLAPLLFEGGMLLLRRLGVPGTGRMAQAGVILASSALALVVLSATAPFNRSMEPFWQVVFYLLAGLAIALMLLIKLLTRPLVEVAAGGTGESGGAVVGRALVEVSYGPLLVSLIVYTLLLLGGVSG